MVIRRATRCGVQARRSQVRRSQRCSVRLRGRIDKRKSKLGNRKSKRARGDESHAGFFFCWHVFGGMAKGQKPDWRSSPSESQGTAAPLQGKLGGSSGGSSRTAETFVAG